MAAFLPSCAETARRLSMAEDSALGLGKRLGMWAHLALCRFCRRYRRQLRFLRRSIRIFQRNLAEISNAKLSEESRRRILDRLSNESS